MPEIKRNFLRGKMNKDHDERLVAKGEYRDAMNIEVSTSEDSNVGAIQNLLGNKRVAINLDPKVDDNSVCVGSIADEKNDAFYYFINNLGDQEITNRFNNNPSGYAPWILGIGVLVTLGPIGVKVYTEGNGTSGPSPAFSHKFNLEDQKNYKVSVRISDVVMDGDTDVQANQMRVFVGGDPSEGGRGTYRPHGYIYAPANANNTLFEAEFDFDRASNYGSTAMRFYVQMTNGDNYAKEIRIIEPSVISNDSCYILRYDTKQDTDISSDNYSNNDTMHRAESVFTDTSGNVLKFNGDNPITGINIIDDKLFWTDGYGEPKKININHTVMGTDSDGVNSTRLWNPAQNISGLSAPLMQEDHITVIKKSPTAKPKIKYELFRDKTKQYHAYTEISDTPNNVNDIINTSKGHSHDFSRLRVGDTFRINLHNPESSLTPVDLEWQNGDEVVLKEYDPAGNSYSVPITEYRIKGTISNWTHNNFSTINPTINSNGNLQSGWSVPAGGAVTAIPTNWVLDGSSWN